MEEIPENNIDCQLSINIPKYDENWILAFQQELCSSFELKVLANYYYQ